MTDRAPSPTGHKSMSVDLLWQIERLGSVSVSPDGAQAVVPVTRFSMDDNKGRTNLWLLSTLGGTPRSLTQAGDKDSQPQWSPRGDQIAFVAKREQEGCRDEESQLYVIAPDGGEARRVTTVATGVEAFRWMPDGRRIVFVSWVWPALRGTAAQAKAHKAMRERKETAYTTSESLYRYWDHHIPMDRVPHLHTVDIDSGKVKDLFEGTPYELARGDPDTSCFDISPDGRRVAFAFDPAAEKSLNARFALAEIELRSGQVRVIRQDNAWDLGAPRYSPDGHALAYLASHVGAKHTMPQQLALWWRDENQHELLSAEWDHEVLAPVQWEDDGRALLFAAEQHARQHVWRFDVADRRAEIVVRGGWVSSYDKAGGTLVTVAESAVSPARVHVHVAGEPARRIETFNDERLAGVDLGRCEEVWFDGAAADGSATADRVQMWLFYPPGFDGKKKTPILHMIHGGPHTALGDTWHYRWNNPTFAAAGYVVAMVNYHGSSSFGMAFKDSITHRWGELELQDIERATDWLLKKPWVDRRRIFAAGGSYGGYLVAWMNGHVPAGRYAAYICHAGCFDWRSMFADDAWAWHAKDLGAWYWDDPARIEQQSPIAFAQHMTTPTLVIHGALDYRVPDAQGLAYYNTLKARRVDARLVWFPDENHWVLKPRNSKLWYGEYFDWLARHDPARKAGGRSDKTGRVAKVDRA